ncbi:MAG: tetratricopeptide repeat protein [Bacteroidia bacterium]|jgi:tetratricopeptide (TPR) repeat protein
MAEVSEKQETSFDVEETVGKAEMFFEKNKKMIGYVGAAIAVLTTAIITYKMWYIPEQNKEAQAQMYMAQSLFDKDSLNLALKGGNYNATTFTGLEEIADNYGSTPSGKVAEYMVGVALLNQGKYQDAIDHLENFSSDDVMLSAVAIGAIGDAKMELNEVDAAIKFYQKAADINTNSFTTPIYLKKAALAYESKSEFADALKLYERIQKEYSKSTEARDIEKYIQRVKTAGNL